MYRYRQYVYHENNLHTNGYEHSHRNVSVVEHVFLSLIYCIRIGNDTVERPRYQDFASYT